MYFSFFFFQAEDGIRDAQESRGLGDVYKRQAVDFVQDCQNLDRDQAPAVIIVDSPPDFGVVPTLSLIHI